MQLTSWEKVTTERLNNAISRQMVNGEHATVARFFLARGAVVPRHSHWSEQFTQIVSGALKFDFDGKEVVARAGEMLFIPSGEAHSAEALEDTVVLDVFAPRRDDWIRNDDAYLRGQAKT